MKIKFKKLHPLAKAPKQGRPDDAGFDLTAVEVIHPERIFVRNDNGSVTSFCEPCSFIEVKFGISVEIPPGYFGLLVPRSSITYTNVFMKNSVGVIDSGYRGELTARFQPIHESFEGDIITIDKYYIPGDRAAQLIILPCPAIEFEETAELSESERGANGYGSTAGFEKQMFNSKIDEVE